MQELFFSTGGTLAPDDPSYIERAADLELEQYLRAGYYVSVLDARQKGKSSLVARVIRKLSEDGYRCIKIDLQRYGSNLTETQWCAGIAATIEQQTADKTLLPKFNKRAKEIGPTSALFDCISGLVANPGSPPTILFCDEIDFVRVLPFAADGFFAAIRSLYNERSVNPALDQLNFCLIGSASPDQLVQNQSTAPFDIAKTVILQDFTAAETYPYANAMPSSTDSPKTCLDQIHYWCNGHPFLTQSVCADLTHSKDPSPAQINTIVQSTFLVKNSIEKNAHLNQIANAFLAPDNQTGHNLVPACLDAYRQILKAPQEVDKFRKDVVSHIRLCGLITIDRGIATPRNRIYSRVFNQAWIRANLPAAERERQRRAARAAALKTGAVAITICGVMAWLAVSNLQLAQKAQKALATSQSNEQRAEQQAYFSAIQVAGNQVNTGNWIAAGKTLANLAESPHRGWEWYYLDQLLNQQISKVNFGQPISSAANHGSNKDFTATARDHILIYRLGKTTLDEYPVADSVIRRLSNNGKFICLRAEGKESFVYGIDGNLLYQTNGSVINFSRDSDYLFVQDAEKNRLLIVSTSTWKPVSTIPFKHGTVHDLHLDGNTEQLVVCFNNRVVGMNRSTGQIIWSRNTANDVRFSILSRDGESILITFAGGPAERWNRTTGKTEVVYKDQDGPITNIVESGDRQHIATGGGNGVVRLYQANSPHAQKTFVGHHGRISGVWFASYDNQLVSCSEDGETRVWQIDKPASTKVIRFGTPAPMYAQVTKSGDRLALGKLNGEIGVISAESQQPVFAIQDNPGSVPRLGFTNNDQQFFVLSARHGLQLRASLDGRLLLQSKPFKSPVIDFDVYNKEGKSYLTTLEQSGQILETENFRKSKPIKLSNPSQPERFAVSPNHRWLAIGHQNGSLTLYDRHLANEAGTYPLHNSIVRNVTFSPDSRFLVTASNDETCAIFDVGKRSITNRLTGHTSRIFNALFSPDGKTVLSISFDGTARLWDARSGNLLHTLQHKSWVADANFSPDGRRVVSGGNDQTLHIWDTASGQELLALENHDSTIFRTMFANQGRRLITVEGSGKVTILDTKAPTIEAKH